MNMLISRKMASIALGMVSFASAASAGTPVIYTYQSESYGGLNMGIHTADFNSDVPVGEFNMVGSTPGYAPVLNTYCTDVNVFLQLTCAYSPTALSSATGVSPAWVAGGIQNAANVWYNNHNSTTTAIQTAGLQLAIWELLYNNVSSVTYSTFYNTSNNGFYLTTTDANSVAAATYAAAVINNLSSQPNNSSQVIWLAPVGANGGLGNSQGLLAVNQSVPDAASTLGLLGLAATGLFAAQRRLSAAMA